MINAETLLVQLLALNPRLKGVPVSTDVPAHRPGQFITVERTGGAETPFLDHPMMAVQCWAPTRTAAGTLAAQTKLALLETTMHPAVARVDIESTSNYPLDATTPRQQIVASLVVHKQSA